MQLLKRKSGENRTVASTLAERMRMRERGGEGGGDLAF